MQTASIASFWLFYFYESVLETVSIFRGPKMKTLPKLSQGHMRLGTVTSAWGNTMKKVLLAGVSLVAIGMIDGAYAETLPPMGKTFCDPYKNYSCLDSYLGDDFITRFINYYRLEWGHEAAPSDPKAPPSRRDYWPGTPMSTPPMPFTEWPYGAATPLA
jgi:hypothetical protein